MRIAMLAGLFLLSAAGGGAAETWTCDVKGTWTVDGEEGTHDLAWTVVYTGAGASWKLNGKGKDHIGSFNTTGTCDATTCAFTQTYSSGEQKDETYFWTATYRDEPARNPAQFVEKLEGTWSNGDTVDPSQGAWTATALCR